MSGDSDIIGRQIDAFCSISACGELIYAPLTPVQSKSVLTAPHASMLILRIPHNVRSRSRAVLEKKTEWRNHHIPSKQILVIRYPTLRSRGIHYLYVRHSMFTLQHHRTLADFFGRGLTHPLALSARGLMNFEVSCATFSKVVATIDLCQYVPWAGVHYFTFSRRHS